MRQRECLTFYAGPLQRVETTFSVDRKYPKVVVEAEDSLLTYFKLCEEGYASSIEQAKMMTAREVIQALHRIQFKADYKMAFNELNKSEE